MAGVTPEEGEDFILTSYLKAADTFIGLFINTSGLGQDSVWADISQQTGTGYSENTLTAASWTVATGEATYANQDFTATAGDWDTTYGYYIRSAANELIHFEVNDAGAIDVADTQTYRVILSLTAS